MSKFTLSSNETNLNADICQVLLDLAEYEKNVSRNIHKYNAYKKAAAVLASHNKRIESGEEAKQLKGIGDKISKKISELLQTGKLKKLENINKDEDVIAINLLTRVSGIGPVKAAELVRSGIKTLEDLKNNEDRLNHHQRIGLKYFEDFQKRIPKAEIQEIETILATSVKKMNKQFSITICGSYRRGNAESGDIDCLITHPDLTLKQKKNKNEKFTLEKIVEALKGLVTDTLSVGETKFMGVCRLNKELPARRLDIRLIPHERFYCAVLYFTGSDVFNKQMRSHALEKGFMLNEYSLRHIGFTGVPGEPVPISSEKEIFLYLEYPYKEPNERNY
ncbi:DNA polymerase beta-like [Anticarsia gemmatalis]|uniref:DNA polymerase beta-like n=1 Tax=Anticarsia gemmatalis TaxID=129554 RepID=UPI003F7769F6